MDSCTIHHTPEGLVLETEDKSVLIGEKDLPLIRRGQPRPIRDMNHESLGSQNYVYIHDGALVVKLDNDEISIPGRVWMDRSGIKRVILSSSLQAVTA